MQYLPASTVSIAGPAAVTVCKNNPSFSFSIRLTGILTYIRGNWRTSGTGSFTPNTSFTGSSGATQTFTYVPSSADTALGTVRLIVSVDATDGSNYNCNTVTDTLDITYTNLPAISAGPDQRICENNLVALLSGSVTNPATGGIWSTNGTGSFGSAGSGQSTSIVLGASYFPSATDLSNGSVQLTLTTTGPGIGTNPGQCAPLTRSMNVTFSARPTIQFGTVPITCENNPTAQITATIVGQTAGQNISLLTKGTWSGGTGTYSPNNSNFNTVNAGALGLVSVGTLTYTPSASELASRAVNLILSATGVGTCAPFTSNFSYTISPKPSSDITTPNPTICANNPVVSIESQITGATNGVWTGGANPVNIISSTGGNFSSQYTPSSAEINSGNAKLYFTTSGESNNCLSERDSMLITISKAPTASTGGDMVVCGALTNVTITGTITGATGGIWNTSGSGTFMNIGGGASTSAGTVAGGNMTIIYTPSALDRASVTPVKLKLTNYGVGNCLAVFDQMNLSFSPIGVADAGVGQTVCNNDFPIQLNATGNSGSWSVSPNPGGSFANANNLSTTYSPATTIAGGTLLTFTWATTGFAAACNVSDTVNIRILPAPIVSVVSPNTVCGSNGYFSVSINGSGFGNAGTWSTSGSGTFSTSGANLSTSYIDYYRPSAADITAGSVTLSFTGTGTSPCSAVRTSKTIRIDPPITAEAGATQTLCDDITSINLNGQIFVNGVSTTSGVGFTWTRVSTVTGSYPVPDPTSNSSSLNVLFTPSAADKNSGGVKLILTPNSLGTCTSPRPDTVTYLFQKAPTASIFGGNFAVCSDTAFAELTGTFTGAAGLIWTTTGTGSFSPDQFATTIRYIPSANDKLFGTVRFGLLTNGSGLCPVKGSASQAVVTIVGKPILSAGPDLTICGNNTAISLTGANMTTTGAYVPSTIVWSTSNSVAPIGTFTNGNTIPNNGVGTLLVYNASSKERLSDQIVTLRVSISGVGAGACPPQSDTRVFTFTPPPIVSAGADMTLCGDASSDAFTLTGTATVANAGRWSPVQGTGSIVGIGNNGLRARYIPSLTDKSRLTTTLGFLLTTTLTGCLDVVDQMNVTLTSVPGVTILGGNQTLCGDALVTNVLNAQSSSGFGIWSTTATGMFSPNSTTLVGVRFAPLQSEIINAYTLSRPIKITLSSDLNGVCAARTTDMFVTITPPPAITAGSDTTVCTDVGSVPLYGGSLTVSSGIVWSTSSSQGRFSNNATTITGTTTTGVSTLVRNVVMESYTPGTAERNAGSVVITARSTGSGQCAEVFAVKNITFIPEPTVSVNPDQTVCANNSLVNCVANVTNAVRVRWFQVGGNGNFLNDAATSTQYFPGKQDSITAALGGVVSITCSVVGNSLCQAKTATFKLRVTQSPVVKTAGTINICADTAGVILSGTSLPALTTVGVQWSNFTNPSSSASNFSANRFLLTPTFLPTAADKASGTVKLLISTTGNGACNAAYDTLRVVIQKVPQIQVPADMNVCTDFGNVINLTFSGQDFTANSLGYWSSTGDGNYGDPSPLNPVQVNQAIAYYVTQNDKNRGRVTLIVNAYDGAGLCKVQTGRINVTFTGLPTVSAGVDGAQCYNSSGNTFSLTGIVSGTEKYGYRWKHAMDYGANLSYITSSNTLIGSTLTVTGGQASDLGILNTSADGVSFIMDAFGIGNSVCKNIQSDTIFIGLPSRFVLSILGLNSICSDISSINIGVKDLGAENQQPSPSGSHPSTTTGFGIQWNARNSSGVDALASQYALNKFQPSITYTLSASDRASGSITFNYTTSGNGVCPAQIDSKTVTINQAPILGTLSGITACSNNSLVTLTASGSNFTNVYWTSSSAVPGTFTGNFTPTVSGLNTAYQPSAEEINIGIANLVLRAQRAGCTDVTRSLAVDIKQAPVVSAGLAGAVCSLTGITVTGTIDPTLSTTTTAGTGWSIVSGSATLVATQYSTSSTTGIMTATNIVTPTGGTSVTLRLTANEPFCNAESSDVTYTFEQTPAIVPGTPFERCASDIIQMQPASTSAQGFWTTSGLGRFASSNSTTTSNMSDVYKPTTAEIENGAVIQFTLIGLPTSCGTPAGVSLTHTLTSGIIAKASEKRIVSVCEDVVPTFTATLTGSSMGTWQAFGSGTFTGTNTTPGNNFTGSTKSVSGVGIPIGGNRFVFTESYRGSAADLAAGRVVIRLSAIPDGINSNCSNNASDTLSIFYTPRPRAFSGGDRSACGNIAVLTTPGGGLSISGTAFLPSPNSIDPFATPINSARLRVVSGSGVFRSTGTQTSNLVSFGGTNLNVTIGIDDVFIASPLDTVPTNPQVRIVVEAIYVGTIVGGATCADVIDTIKVGLARAPYAFITTTTNGLCNDLTEIKIFGDIKQVPTGVWSTTGTGRISPDSTWNDALSPAVYTLSNAERNITAPQNIFFILQSDPTGSGCLAEVSSVLTVTIYPRPIISVTGAQIVCADLTQITLSGVNTTLGSNPTAYTWISNGSGTISGLGAMPSANFPGIYSLNNNDIAFGSLQFTLSTSGPNTCKSLTKLVDVSIAPRPTISLSLRQELCRDSDTLKVAATINNASGVSWTVRRCLNGVCTAAGTGSFVSGSNNSLTGIYLPSTADLATVNSDSLEFTAITTGSNTNNAIPSCNDVSASTYVKMTPLTSATINSILGICADLTSVNLSGLVSVAGGGKWSSSGGGTFFNDFTLPTVSYQLSAEERNIIFPTTVGITLTTESNGTCKPFSANFTLSITGSPKLETGADKNVCADTKSIPLTDAVATLTGGGFAWNTLGTGSFTGTNLTGTNLTGTGISTAPGSFTYIPSAADSANGAVILVMTSTGPNPCNPVESYMTIRFDRTPNVTVSAGLDQVVCADNPLINLNGVVINGQNPSWRAFKDATVVGNDFSQGTGRGSFSPDSVTLNASYFPSVQDTSGATSLFTNQVVRIRLRAYGTGSCSSQLYESSMRVTFTPLPRINVAVSPSSICANDMSAVSLTGQFLNNIAAGGSWTSSGTGNGNQPNSGVSFASVVNPPISTPIEYLPSTADKTNNGGSGGRVGFTFTTQAQGTCRAVSKSLSLVINPAPSIAAGFDQAICETQTIIGLSASTSRIASGFWRSSGTGSFTTTGINIGLSVNTTNGPAIVDHYRPSAADIASGKINLFVKSTSQQNNCPADSSKISLSFDLKPIVNAGLDQTICAEPGVMSFTGALTNVTEAIWSVQNPGSGSFSPNASNLSLSYKMSENDKVLNNLVFSLTSNSTTSKCPAVTSTPVTVTINKLPTATVDYSYLCTSPGIALVASTSNSLFGTWTSTGVSGTRGTFSPTSAPVPFVGTGVSYIPSSDDIANGSVSIALIANGLGTCASTKTTITPSLKPNPNPPADGGSDAIICRSQSYNLNVRGFDPNKNFTYQWLAPTVPGNTLTTIAGQNQLSVTVITNTVDSLYVLKVVDNVNKCSTLDTVKIITKVPVQIPLSPQVCYKDNLLLSDQLVTLTGGRFQWYRDGQILPQNSDPNRLKAVIPAKYTLEYTEFGCVSDTITNVRPLPFLLTKGKVVCKDTPFEISPTVITVTSYPSANYTYKWYHDYNRTVNGFVYTLENTNTVTGIYAQKVLAINGIQADTANYLVSVMDSLGCQNYDTVRVKTHPKPLMALQDNPACEGDVVTLDARPDNRQITKYFAYPPTVRRDTVNAGYAWLTDPAGLVVAPRDTMGKIIVTTAGTYFVKYQIGECFARDTSKVQFNVLPKVNNAPEVLHCPDGGKGITLDAGEGLDYRYLWLASGKTSRYETVYDTSKYYFKVFNKYGCNVLDSVNVKASCEPKVFTPGAFVPDGDDPRDRIFTIFGKHFSKMKITIYNRWGEVIFVSEDVNFGWDGTYQGSKMPMGVYPYIITYEGKFDEYKKPVTERKSVTLIR
jgi:gliding motility-associated-like protein